MWVAILTIVSAVVTNLSIRELRKYEYDCDKESFILQLFGIIPVIGWIVAPICMIGAMLHRFFNNENFYDKVIKVLFGK